MKNGKQGRTEKSNCKKFRLISTIIFIFLCFAGLKWFFSAEHIKQMIINKLENRLDKRVNIRDIKINLLSNLYLSDITISDQEQTPFVQLKEVEMDYSLSSLLQKRLHRIVIEDPNIQFKNNRLNVPSDNEFSINKINGLFNLFCPLNIVVNNAHLSKANKPVFKIDDLNIEAQNLSNTNEVIYYIKLEIEKAKYVNFSANNTKIDMVYKEGAFDIKSFNSKIFNGTAEGKGEIKFQCKEVVYRLASEIEGVDLKEFCEHNIASKYKVTGIADGYISIEGANNKLHQLKGEFTSVDTGGTINATTFQLLMLHIPEGTLKNTLTSIFDKKEDFVYDKGKIKLALHANGDILINLFLKGPRGNFSFDINIENEVVQSFLRKRYF